MNQAIVKQLFVTAGIVIGSIVATFAAMDQIIRNSYEAQINGIKAQQELIRNELNRIEKYLPPEPNEFKTGVRELKTDMRELETKVAEGIKLEEQRIRRAEEIGNKIEKVQDECMVLLAD